MLELSLGWLDHIEGGEYGWIIDDEVAINDIFGADVSCSGFNADSFEYIRMEDSK